MKELGPTGPEAAPLTPATGGALKTPGGSPWGTPTSTHGSDEKQEEKVGAAETQKTKPIRRLGSGGQGTVWLVEHLGRKEALKVLLKRGKVESDVFREAENTRKVDHPNIVDVFGTEVLHPNVLRGFGLQEEQECPALRMEFVDGWDLARLVEDEGVFTIEELVPLAIQVAGALRATHKCGIVHHDLKPSNLILRKDRRTVVVTDFGISAALRERDGKLGAGRGGTPFFMAPELHQSDGRGTPESDIWSLGVTLYFLATRTYPFPFESAKPEEAIQRPARNPCEIYRHVSNEFWQLLRRMLRQDGAQPFATMAELEKELEFFASSVECPACGGVFRVESIAGACPEPGCQARAIAGLKQGRSCQREGETALANCDFAAAGVAIQKARDEFAAAGLTEAAQRSTSVHGSLNDLEKAHASALEEARTHFAAERYVKCVRTLAAARVLFSRSPGLNAVRMQTRERILEVYKQAEPQVAWFTRNRDFRAARDILTKVDHFLGEEHARRELVLGLGEEPADFRWLNERVEERELRFRKFTGRAREAIFAFDFDRAITNYKRLESEFPADENAQMIQKLQRAIPSYAAATAHEEAFLESTASDPASAQQAERIGLRAGLQGAEELIAAFPPQDFTPYQRFEVLRGLYARALEAVLALVRQRSEEARLQTRVRNAFRARELLDSVRLLVLRSDLFEMGEREAFLKELREAEEQCQQIERLYKEGSQALEQREYAEASLAFRQLAALAPEGYGELAQRLALATQKRDEVSALEDEVTRGFAQIEKSSFTPEGALHTLRRAQRLDELASDTRRDRMEAELGSAITRLFDSQREYASTLGAAGSEKVLAFLGTATAALVQTFPAERWPAVVGRSAELRRAMIHLVELGLPAKEDPVRKDPVGALARVESLLQVLQRLAPMSVACVPPPGASHPSLAAGAVCLEAFHRARIAQTRELLPRVGALLLELKKLAPPAIQAEFDKNLEGLRELERRGTRHLAALRVRHSLPFLIVTALAFVAAFGWAEFRTRREFSALHAGMLGRLGLPGEEEAQARGLLESQPELYGFFDAWGRVKNKENTNGWFLVSGILEQRSGLALGALEAAMNAHITTAAEVRVKQLLQDAIEVMSKSALPGVGSRDRVEQDIEAMAAALGNDASIRELRDRLTSLAIFVGSAEGSLPAALGVGWTQIASQFRTVERRRQLVARLIERSRLAKGDKDWKSYWEEIDPILQDLQGLGAASPFERRPSGDPLEDAATHIANLLMQAQEPSQ